MVKNPVPIKGSVGLFIANIKPYAALNGNGVLNQTPWQHLQTNGGSSQGLNKWRAEPFRQAVEAHLTLEQWLPETDTQAVTVLTPDILSALSDYSEDELTCSQIVVVAKK
ncbi:MAG: hypothetical protein AAF485_14540 [Chloroflexota bacterium]